MQKGFLENKSAVFSAWNPASICSSCRSLCVVGPVKSLIIGDHNFSTPQNIEVVKPDFDKAIQFQLHYYYWRVGQISMEMVIVSHLYLTNIIFHFQSMLEGWLDPSMHWYGQLHCVRIFEWNSSYITISHFWSCHLEKDTDEDLEMLMLISIVARHSWRNVLWLKQFLPAISTRFYVVNMTQAIQEFSFDYHWP